MAEAAASARRDQLKSQGSKRAKLNPRKRYYNGIGKINPSSIQFSDQTQVRARMTSLTSRQQTKTHQQVTKDYSRPYPYAFMLENLDRKQKNRIPYETLGGK